MDKLRNPPYRHFEDSHSVFGAAQSEMTSCFFLIVVFPLCSYQTRNQPGEKELAGSSFRWGPKAKS